MINERSKGYSDLLLISNFKIISMHLKLFNISVFLNSFSVTLILKLLRAEEKYFLLKVIMLILLSY